MMTCIVAIVAFREHHSFHGFKHVVIPVFGLIANLGCMVFYLVGPFMVPGMSWHEPFIALGVAALWGIDGSDLLHDPQQEVGQAGDDRIPPSRHGSLKTACGRSNLNPGSPKRAQGPGTPLPGPFFISMLRRSANALDRIAGNRAATRRRCRPRAGSSRLAVSE